jgi:hypothetical protein
MTVQEEKKSSPIKKIIIGILIGIVVVGAVVAGIALQIFQNPSSSTSPYVELDYKTVGWFFGSTLLGGTYNHTYLILNVNIINHGYSSVYWGSLNVTINGQEYQAEYYCPTLYNSTGINAIQYDFSSLTLSIYYSLNDGQSAKGYVIFEFVPVSSASSQIWKSQFTVGYSANQVPLGSATVKIVKES